MQVGGGGLETVKDESSCSGEQRKASSCSGEVHVPIQLPTVELIGVWALERVLGGSFNGPLCWVSLWFQRLVELSSPIRLVSVKSGLVMLSPIRGEDDFYLSTDANKSNRAS